MTGVQTCALPIYEWTKAKFASGKWKSSELYPTPKDPAIKREYEEYKAQRLGKK